jgi:hypothetical protein
MRQLAQSAGVYATLPSSLPYLPHVHQLAIVAVQQTVNVRREKRVKQRGMVKVEGFR